MELISIKHRENIYSPFSGIAVSADEGHDEKDTTLMLVYYGDAGSIAYVSERLVGTVDEDQPIGSIIAGLELPNGIAMEVDTHENGVNYFVFAPA